MLNIVRDGNGTEVSAQGSVRELVDDFCHAAEVVYAQLAAASEEAAVLFRLGLIMNMIESEPAEGWCIVSKKEE